MAKRRVKFYSPPQAAKILDVSLKTIYRWIRAGKIAAQEMPGDGKHGTRYKIPAGEVTRRVAFVCPRCDNADIYYMNVYKYQFFVCVHCGAIFSERKIFSSWMHDTVDMWRENVETLRTLNYEILDGFTPDQAMIEREEDEAAADGPPEVISNSNAKPLEPGEDFPF